MSLDSGYYKDTSMPKVSKPKNKFGFEKNDLKVFRGILKKMSTLKGGKWKHADEEIRFVTKRFDDDGDILAYCPISSAKEQEIGKYVTVARVLGLSSSAMADIVNAADEIPEVREYTTDLVAAERETRTQLAIREALLLAAFNKLPKGSMPKGYKPQLATR